MTKEEELAEEYVNNKADKGNYDLEQFGKAYFSESSMKQAFLAGLKAKTQWHDLRKNPDDLPNTHCGNWVIALYDNGTLWCRARREEFVEGIFWVNSHHYQIYNVIAWKEIVLPKELAMLMTHTAEDIIVNTTEADRKVTGIAMTAGIQLKTMTKEEENLIIAEQNKSRDEILKAAAKMKSDYHELCNLKDMRIANLEKENAELKEKLTAVRNAKDKYDMSKDKSIIKAFGAEYTLFCDLERILEDWQEDDKLTEAKALIKNLIRVTYDEGWNYSLGVKARAEQFLKED